jgi:predicted RND superfamily exporter protein
LGALSVLPNMFPLLCAATYLHVIGKPLEIGSIMVFTICLGIAVDDTIHLVFRFGRELQASGDVARAMKIALHRVGQALIITTVVLLAGYGSLLLSQVAVLVTFGILACLAIAAALIGDLLILPALLLWFVPQRRRKREAV